MFCLNMHCCLHPTILQIFHNSPFNKSLSKYELAFTVTRIRQKSDKITKYRIVLVLFSCFLEQTQSKQKKCHGNFSCFFFFIFLLLIHFKKNFPRLVVWKLKRKKKKFSFFPQSFHVCFVWFRDADCGWERTNDGKYFVEWKCKSTTCRSAYKREKWARRKWERAKFSSKFFLRNRSTCWV